MSENLFLKLQWLIFAIYCCSFNSVSLGQDVRWKFSVGDKFAVTQDQATTIDTLVEKRRSKITSQVILSVTWDIIGVDDGTATIEQTVDAIKISINNPADNTKSVDIDTTSEIKPSKRSRNLLKLLEPLIGMTFTLEMSDRGEVVMVSVPKSAQQRLDSIPADSSLKTLLDPNTLQEQFKNTTLTLPEQDLPKGKSTEIISTQSSKVAPMLGKRKMTYDGQKLIGIRRLDVFDLSSTEGFDRTNATLPNTPDTTDYPDIGSFQWSGQMLFDRQAGHCVSCDQKTMVKTSRSYRDMAMSTTVITDSVFTLRRK